MLVTSKKHNKNAPYYKVRGIFLRKKWGWASMVWPLLLLGGCADPYLNLADVPQREPSPLPAPQAKSEIQGLKKENAQFHDLERIVLPTSKTS